MLDTHHLSALRAELQQMQRRLDAPASDEVHAYELGEIMKRVAFIETELIVVRLNFARRI